MRGNQGLIPRRRKVFYLSPVVPSEREIFKYGNRYSRSRTRRSNANEIRTIVFPIRVYIPMCIGDYESRVDRKYEKI